MKVTKLILLLFTVCITVNAQYSTTGIKNTYTSGIHADSSIIIAWATNVLIQRGLMRIDSAALGYAGAGEPEDALGKADNNTVSLGDSGIAVLSFEDPLSDTEGPDFAVFENSFDGSFLELAFVEVSSDSSTWVRFPSVSDTDTINQIASFGTVSSGDLYNLAGKHRAMYGTPFDLAELKDSAGINTDSIRYIKILDVIGSVDPAWCSRDSRGYPVNDPWPTGFESSGFDLDAVAMLGGITGIEEGESTTVSIFPNPVKDILYIRSKQIDVIDYQIVSFSGFTVKSGKFTGSLLNVSIHDLDPGYYILRLHGKIKTEYFRFIKSF